jgi:hypothetical protein
MAPGSRMQDPMPGCCEGIGQGSIGLGNSCYGPFCCACRSDTRFCPRQNPEEPRSPSPRGRGRGACLARAVAGRSEPRRAGG